MYTKAKYANDILRRFRLLNCKSTAMPGTKLSKDDEGSRVDPTLFKRMVGDIMYLIETRTGIMFVVI